MVRIIRHARRAAAALTATVIVLTTVVAVIIATHPTLALGASVVDDHGPALVPNPALAGTSSILDLSGHQVRSTALPPRTIALTFDDGPDTTWTPAVQAVLDRHHVHGTFFVIGAAVVAHPEIVRALHAAGNEIGNETYTHARFEALSSWQAEAQVALTQRAVEGATGTAPAVFRPPYAGQAANLPAALMQASADHASGNGLTIVLSDRVPRDYDPSASVSEIVADALPPLGQSAVITFHDGGGDRAKTVAALDQVVTTLQGQGYQFATASQLAQQLPAPPVPAPHPWEAAAFVRFSRFVDALPGVFLLIGAVCMALGVVRAAVMLVGARAGRRAERRARPVQGFAPPVTVVVPAYNEEVGIAAAVRSIVDTDYPVIEVIVVDDGSTDATAAVVRALELPAVRVLQQPNGGKASALNAGALQARHDIVVMVDGDTIFERDTIERLVQPFADPEVGAVAGNPKVGNRRGLIARLQHVEYTVASAVERRMFVAIGAMTCVPGAVGAFRRRAVVEVGGVSRDTLAEDADLTMAIQRAGWKVAFASGARAWTEVPCSLRGLARQRVRWSYGTLQALWKHRGAARDTGPAGRLGRVVLPYAVIFGYLGALAAPAADLQLVFSVLTGGSLIGRSLLLWLAINAVSAAVAAYAFRLDGERLRGLWVLPLQQVLYRQVLYITTLESLWSALTGVRLPWNKLARTGSLTIDLRPGSDDAVIDLREVVGAGVSAAAPGEGGSP